LGCAPLRLTRGVAMPQAYGGRGQASPGGVWESSRPFPVVPLGGWAPRKNRPRGPAADAVPDWLDLDVGNFDFAEEIIN